MTASRPVAERIDDRVWMLAIPLAVPYATAAPNYDIRTVGDYQVTGATGQATVAVSAGAVQRGEEIAVALVQ